MPFPLSAVHDRCWAKVFKGNKVISDIICVSDNKYYYYNSLVGKDNDLDRFAKENYQYRKTFNENKNEIKSDEYLTIYNNFDDLKLGIENYKGIYLANTINFLKKKYQ